MTHWRAGLIVGLILIAVGIGGLAAGWGLGRWGVGSGPDPRSAWTGPDPMFGGPMRGPRMHGFGGHHMSGPWSEPGTRGRTLPPVAGARTVEVEAADFMFSPAEITVKAGEVVNLVLVNRGVTVHDLVIPADRIWLVAPAGQSATTGFRAVRPGEYEFYCSVPGHREAGMVGRIVVTP